MQKHHNRETVRMDATWTNMVLCAVWHYRSLHGVPQTPKHHQNAQIERRSTSHPWGTPNGKHGRKNLNTEYNDSDELFVLLFLKLHLEHKKLEDKLCPWKVLKCLKHGFKNVSFQERNFLYASHVFLQKVTARENSASHCVRPGASLVVCARLLPNCKMLYFWCRSLTGSSSMYSMFIFHWGVKNLFSKSGWWRCELIIWTALMCDINELSFYYVEPEYTPSCYNTDTASFCC